MSHVSAAVEPPGPETEIESFSGEIRVFIPRWKRSGFNVERHRLLHKWLQLKFTRPLSRLNYNRSQVHQSASIPSQADRTLLFSRLRSYNAMPSAPSMCCMERPACLHFSGTLHKFIVTYGALMKIKAKTTKGEIKCCCCSLWVFAADRTNWKEKENPRCGLVNMKIFGVWFIDDVMRFGGNFWKFFLFFFIFFQNPKKNWVLSKN